MTNWKETTLGEIATIKGGKRLPLGDSLQKERSLHPYIKVTNVSGNAVNGVDEYVPDSVFEKIKRYTVDSGDVILSIVGTIGLVGKVPEYLHKANLTENCVKILPSEKLDSNYLFYFLSSRVGQSEILKNTVGAVQPKLPIYGVQNINLILPPIEEQKEIAGVLSSLDDKIELLQEENKTLEATAQVIFKEWFVNFNFPNAEGKPYKSSGGKMIDSDLGEIPEGWRVGKLGDSVDIRGGTTPSTKSQDFWNGVISWTSPKDLSNFNSIFLLKTEKTITEKGLSKISSGLLPIGTLLLSSRAPIGYLAITNIELAINQGYIAFLPNKYLLNQFMYLWLKINMDTVIGASNGSTFLEISKSSFRKIEIIVPDQVILNMFQLSVNPIFERILNNTHQIQTLSILRDTLLPKLMSGKVGVKV